MVFSRMVSPQMVLQANVMLVNYWMNLGKKTSIKMWAILTSSTERGYHKPHNKGSNSQRGNLITTAKLFPVSASGENLK